MLTMLPILEPKPGTPMDVKKRTPLSFNSTKRNVKDSLRQQVRHWAAKMILGNRLTRRRPIMTKNQNFAGERTCKGDNASPIAHGILV